MRSLQANYEKYRLTLPEKASPVQHYECKFAFYTGAYAMYSMFHEASENNLSDEANQALIDSWHDELRHYAEKEIKAECEKLKQQFKKDNNQ